MKIDRLRGRWERLVALASLIGGMVLVILGWAGASRSSLTTEQIPYLASGAVGGLFLLGVSATIWLSADLRDEFFEIDELFAWLQGDQVDGTEDADDAQDDAQTANGPVATNGGAPSRRAPLRAR